MGGNAGTQTLTVVVRQLALGAIKFENAKAVLKKEVVLALFNGSIFATIMGLITYFWFDNVLLGGVMAMAMMVNILVSAIFGASIPILLKRLDIDPAIGSSVVLTTVTDIIGFLSFLMLAQYLILS